MGFWAGGLGVAVGGAVGQGLWVGVGLCGVGEGVEGGLLGGGGGVAQLSAQSLGEL